MRVSFGKRYKRPVMWNVLSVIGLIAIGAIVIPAMVGLVASAPDIVRYLKVRRM